MDKFIDAKNIQPEINEIIKFTASSLIAIILDQNLEKAEIMSTLRLWKKQGWHKPVLGGMRKDEPLRDDIKIVCDDNDGAMWKVGNNGITKIKEAQRYGEFCMITYYKIYKDNKHSCDVHRFTFVEYL